jgi:hypothetical protein
MLNKRTFFCLKISKDFKDVVAWGFSFGSSKRIRLYRALTDPPDRISFWSCSPA